MPKFRKKPLIIEAVQFTPQTVRKVYEFVNGEGSAPPASCAMGEDYGERYENALIKEGFPIKTPEGELRAPVGHWILKGYTETLGVHFWPVEPGYFAENYEAVEE